MKNRQPDGPSTASLRETGNSRNCPHCGAQITEPYASFCPGHDVAFRHQMQCGAFYALYRDQIHDLAAALYAAPTVFRAESRLLFEMLNCIGVTSLNQVGPAHIRYFFCVVRKERVFPQDRLHRLKTLFAHLIATGAYVHASPVRPAELMDSSDDDGCIRQFAAGEHAWMPRAHVDIRLISPEEKLCDGPDCHRYVMPGAYSAEQRFFYCSAKCRFRRQKNQASTKRTAMVTCAFPGCASQVKCSTASTGQVHHCPSHVRIAAIMARDQEACGPFLSLFGRYMQNFAQGHYRYVNPARSEVRMFFAFLVGLGLTDVNQVEPAHIEAFQDLRGKTKEAPRADYVKKMFDYLIECGLYQSFNPVISSIHYEKRSRGAARPYDDATRARHWEALEHSNETRAKVAVAVLEEAGPRSVDICRIHLAEVDLSAHRIWIGAKNKNNRGGYIPLSPRSERYIRLWLIERPKGCGHDYLLTNSRGGRMCPYSLRRLLNAILSEANGGPVQLHRYRHASASWMHAHGVAPETNSKIHLWEHSSSRDGYIGLQSDRVGEQCDLALDLWDSMCPSLRMPLSDWVEQAADCGSGDEEP